jgi:hypothetical protein
LVKGIESCPFSKSILYFKYQRELTGKKITWGSYPFIFFFSANKS